MKTFILSLALVSFMSGPSTHFKLEDPIQDYLYQNSYHPNIDNYIKK